MNQLNKQPSISPTSVNILNNWGFQGGHWDFLIKQFNNSSYNSGFQRFSDINTAYIHNTSEETLVFLNFFSDLMGSKERGDCYDQAQKVITALQLSSFMKSLDPDVHLLLQSGESRTHFHGPNAVHFWATLMNKRTFESVILDPSFGEICELSESGYIPNYDRVLHPRTLSYGSKIISALTCQVQGTNISNIANTNSLHPNSVVLGMTPDMQYALSFGLMSDVRSGLMLPYINGVSSEGHLDFRLTQTPWGLFTESIPGLGLSQYNEQIQRYVENHRIRLLNIEEAPRYKSPYGERGFEYDQYFNLRY